MSRLSSCCDRLTILAELRVSLFLKSFAIGARCDRGYSAKDSREMTLTLKSRAKAYLDKQNEFVMDRFPLPFIEMNPEDMSALGLKEGDLVEVFNDNGSTQAMVYPTPTAKPPRMRLRRRR